MTDRDALAGALHDGICTFEDHYREHKVGGKVAPDAEYWTPCHPDNVAPTLTALTASGYVLVEVAEIERLRAVEAALQRLIKDVDPLDWEQGICDWCGGGWEDVPGPRGGKARHKHTGKHLANCPFTAAQAALATHPAEGGTE